MIKIVVFDFDGVFTDGKCYFDNKNIKKYYNVKDGMALKILKNNNIKTCLISSYSSKKEIYLNDNKIDEEIINHLKFDYKYIGKERKIDILDNWLNELNLNYNSIAYIGDDINDIEIMEKINYSACPNDAVKEVKDVVNYICKKRGGEGCVREFVDKIINFTKEISIIDEIRTEFNYQIKNFNLDNINELSEIIKSINGNIYFCGVGKSGNIANHCCDLLKCISFPAFYLDILNSTHGDIGTLTNKDIIIMFSNSGNTRELIDIIPLFKNIGIKTVGICCNEKSQFKELTDLNIITPFKKEIGGEINKIPTNSFMSHLTFSNILVSILKQNITVEQYKKNHLSGNIGKDLLKVKDVLIKEFPKIIIRDNNNIDIKVILLEMTKYQMGCCFFVNKTNKLLGILTDGDIRKLLIKDEIKYINNNNINNNYYYENDLNNYINKSYNYIPIIINEKLIGVVSWIHL